MLFLFPDQGLLLRDKGAEAQSLDQVVKQKNLPENQQEAFKTGFTEGFMRSQAFTQRTQGMLVHRETFQLEEKSNSYPKYSHMFIAPVASSVP